MSPEYKKVKVGIQSQVILYESWLYMCAYC